MAWTLEQIAAAVVQLNNPNESVGHHVVAEASDHVTLELVAEHGPAQADLESTFAQMEKDSSGSLDGVDDQANRPIDVESENVRRDLSALAAND